MIRIGDRKTFSKKDKDDIVDYWRGYYLDNLENLQKMGVTDDKIENILEFKWEDGKGDCFCCGGSTSQLEVCHIIPLQLNPPNPNEPSNLFLMCKECHKMSPDFEDSKYFFNFIWRQPQSSTRNLRRAEDFVLKLTKYIENNGIREDVVRNINNTLERELGRSFDKAGTHNSIFTESTLDAICDDWVRNVLAKLTK